MQPTFGTSRPAGFNHRTPSGPAQVPSIADAPTPSGLLPRNGIFGRTPTRISVTAGGNLCAIGLGPSVPCRTAPRPLSQGPAGSGPWRNCSETTTASSASCRHPLHGHAGGCSHGLSRAGGCAWSCSGLAVAPRRRQGGRQQSPSLLATAAVVADAGPRAPDPGELKVSELQAALRALGLPVSGRKADLVERLLAAQGGGEQTAGSPAAAEGAATTAHELTGRVTVRRTRTRSSTQRGEDEAEGPDAQIGGRGGASSELPTPADGAEAAMPRRRRTAERRTAAAPQSASDPAEAAATTTAAPTDDASLDDLFAAVKWEISVAAGDAREARQRGGQAATKRANGDGDGGNAGAVGQSPNRRRHEPADLGSDLDSDLDSSPAASGDSDRGSLRRRRAAEPALAVTAAAAAAAAATTTTAEAAAAPERRSSRGVRGAVASGAGPATATPPGSASASQDLDPDLGQEYDLPPWPPMFMGEMKTLEELAPGNADAQEELLLGNVPGMALTVLGSAAVRPTASRAFASLAMARVKDIFIFDAGDDTQRQVAQAYHVKPSKIYRIFLTSLEPECVLGLPGLMCVINASRERGHEVADIPVHVYGPPGTADFLAAMMRVSQTCLDVTIVVHEISTGPVAPVESEPYLYVKRARIWRTLMPPDQVNPRGGVDASLLLFAPDQGRSQKKRGRHSSGGVLSFDPRAGFLPFPPLEPGNPYKRQHEVDPRLLSWTLELDVTARVIINQLPGARGPVLSYTVVEADRAGALVLERATAAGLVGGPDFARLKAGEAVKNSWGLMVPPELVISPKRPGRRVVVLGNTVDPSVLSPEAHPHMAAADVLVAGAVWPKDEADVAAMDGGCTAEAWGETAARLGVRYVLLNRFDGQRMDEQDGYARIVAAQVVEAAAAASAALAAPRRLTGSRSGARAGPRSAADWRRRVVALGDLDSVIVDKNEGPQERDPQGRLASVVP